MPNNSVNICPFCGASVNADCIFCTQCGHRLTENPQNDQTEPSVTGEEVLDAFPQDTFESLPDLQETENPFPEDTSSSAQAKPAEEIEEPAAFEEDAAVLEFDNFFTESPKQESAPQKPVGEASNLALQSMLDSMEKQSALAKGLPDWDIEPPHLMINRKKRDK